MPSLDRNDYQCRQTGLCCRGAAVENPEIELIHSASRGSEISRDFLSLFVPYHSHEIAIHEAKEAVDASFEVANERGSQVKHIVFYKCQFLSGNHTCTIYEDRPNLCRDYPDSPFTAIAKSCGYRQWYEATQDIQKEDLRSTLETLKNIDASLKHHVILHPLPYGWISSYS